MRLSSPSWPRLIVSLLPLVIALLHTLGILHFDWIDQRDNVLYDMRLQATMPHTLDPRIVIVNIDEKSLAEQGHWPWGRNKLAALTESLFEQQKIALLGIDLVFSEVDTTSGLANLQSVLAKNAQTLGALSKKIERWQQTLDYDAQFANEIAHRPVVLSYYFTNTHGVDGTSRQEHVQKFWESSGQLPVPVLSDSAMPPTLVTQWDGFAASIPALANAASQAGFFNALTDNDGVVRAIPLIANFKGNYYASLALAMYRVHLGMPNVKLNRPQPEAASLESVSLEKDGKILTRIRVDERGAVLVPYRGAGGVAGGSFQYVSAADILAHRLPLNSLAGKIVLIGTTTPGLLDVRTTPAGIAYPGVEVHANMLSSLLDASNHRPVKPDYARGYELLLLLVTGLLLTLLLPRLMAPAAILMSLGVLVCVVALDIWLFKMHGLVFPLANVLIMGITTLVLNLGYGYFVEGRSKRKLVRLFGTYVPPELVDQMLQRPNAYSMKAVNKELTVMFCDIRGFTHLSETMQPEAMQALLKNLFSQLSHVISRYRGTIDKYMGDCIMAFWGAPVDLPEHANLALRAAQEMVQVVQAHNQQQAQLRAQLPDLSLEALSEQYPFVDIRIGLNSGAMYVGDMGSDLRRSYTVIGDAVNIASRLQGLASIYGTFIIAGDATHEATPGTNWFELDWVRLKGKSKAVRIFSPLEASSNPQENALWQKALLDYRQQRWEACREVLDELLVINPKNAHYLTYQMYAKRVSSRIGYLKALLSNSTEGILHHGFDPNWDGITIIDSK